MSPIIYKLLGKAVGLGYLCGCLHVGVSVGLFACISALRYKVMLAAFICPPTLSLLIFCYGTLSGGVLFAN